LGWCESFAPMQLRSRITSLKDEVTLELGFRHSKMAAKARAKARCEGVQRVGELRRAWRD